MSSSLLLERRRTLQDQVLLFALSLLFPSQSIAFLPPLFKRGIKRGRNRTGNGAMGRSEQRLKVNTRSGISPIGKDNTLAESVLAAQSP